MIKPDIESVKKALKKHDFPVDVIIETIALCNLKCVMCPQDSLTRPRGQMNVDLFKKIIDEVSAAAKETKIWLAIMGEPLLCSRIIEMVEYTTAMGLPVHLNTNAMLLNKQMSSFLVEAGVKQFVVGLDAMDADTYSKIRVNGDGKTVKKNTLDLLEIADNVVVQFIEMEENTDQMEAFKDYWLGKGAIVKIRPRLGWGKGVPATNLEDFTPERFPCGWLNRTVSIHWDGNVAQCDGDYDGKHYAGNLNQQTIKELWEGELAARRERHWNKDFSHELCANCQDWKAGRSYVYHP